MEHLIHYFLLLPSHPYLRLFDSFHLAVKPLPLVVISTMCYTAAQGLAKHPGARSPHMPVVMVQSVTIVLWHIRRK